MAAIHSERKMDDLPTIVWSWCAANTSELPKYKEALTIAEIVREQYEQGADLDELLSSVRGTSLFAEERYMWISRASSSLHEEQSSYGADRERLHDQLKEAVRSRLRHEPKSLAHLMDDEPVKTLVRQSLGADFATDSYRRILTVLVSQLERQGHVQKYANR